MSSTRYYQVLNSLIDNPAALAADPMLVKRLRRLRAARQRQRSARRLGIEVTTGPDCIEIRPGVPQAAEIDCHGDHRIAMSFSVTALRTPGITLDDPDCVKKTFPDFHAVLAGLRQEWGL